MKITFIKDCPPIVESGNSFYKVDTQADLRKGQELIDLGYARDGWGEDKNLVEVVNQFNPDYTLKSIFESMDTSELKEIAKEKGIKGYGRMGRNTLIKRLANE